jgi:DNA-directed RNA polymerase specialized sigma24 family protein
LASARSAEAEDLAQDTFMRAVVHFERFDPERLGLAWLIAIARRLCLDLPRRRTVSARVETMGVNEAPPASPEGGSGACDYSQLVIEHRGVLA